MVEVITTGAEDKTVNMLIVDCPHAKIVGRGTHPFIYCAHPTIIESINQWQECRWIQGCNACPEVKKDGHKNM